MRPLAGCVALFFVGISSLMAQTVPLVVDCGQIPRVNEGAGVTSFTIVARNAGDTTVTVTDIERSCTCSEAVFAASGTPALAIGPKQSAEVRVAYDGTGKGFEDSIGLMFKLDQQAFPCEIRIMNVSPATFVPALVELDWSPKGPDVVTVPFELRLVRSYSSQVTLHSDSTTLATTVTEAAAAAGTDKFTIHPHTLQISTIGLSTRSPTTVNLPCVDLTTSRVLAQLPIVLYPKPPVRLIPDVQGLGFLQMGKTAERFCTLRVEKPEELCSEFEASAAGRNGDFQLQFRGVRSGALDVWDCTVRFEPLRPCVLVNEPVELLLSGDRNLKATLYLTAAVEENTSRTEEQSR